MVVSFSLERVKLVEYFSNKIRDCARAQKIINESKNNITAEINEIKPPITREHTGKLDNFMSPFVN